MYSVKVSEIPSSTTDDRIQSFFSFCGEITSVNRIAHDQAILIFATAEGMKMASYLNKAELDGNTIAVQVLDVASNESAHAAPVSTVSNSGEDFDIFAKGWEKTKTVSKETWFAIETGASKVNHTIGSKIAKEDDPNATFTHIVGSKTNETYSKVKESEAMQTTAAAAKKTGSVIADGASKGWVKARGFFDGLLKDDNEAAPSAPAGSPDTE